MLTSWASKLKHGKYKVQILNMALADLQFPKLRKTIEKYDLYPWLSLWKTTDKTQDPATTVSILNKTGCLKAIKNTKFIINHDLGYDLKEHWFDSVYYLFDFKIQLKLH